MTELFAALWCIALAIPAIAGGPASPPVTTVITHGFTTGEKGAWVQGMAEAILARAGGGSIYRYTGASAVWTYVPSPFADGTTGNIVCIFNWVPESATSQANGPNWRYVQAAGDALYAALRDPVFAGSPPQPAPSPPSSLSADRWLHLIGHSRGACVISETALRFARDGLTVDQLTTLDPHPVNGTLDAPLNFNWSDPTPARWSNVTFHDNYWRADGGFLNAADFDGIALSGAFNTQFTESVLDCSSCGYGSGHSNVHLWLHGTIDLGPTPFDGEATITAAMRASWYPQGYAQRGWFYSRLGGGAALRPAVGAASVPPATPYVMGGDFNNASYAGWSYHGGAVGGQIVNESGVQYVKIGAGFGGAAITRHNRMFVPAGATHVKLDTRTIAAGNAAGETLRIAMVDQTGVITIVADDPIPTVAGAWVVNRQFAIPAGLTRGRTFQLSVQVISTGTATAVIGLDNIDLAVAVILPADVNADGCVNVTDLLAVIGAWGPCAAAPAECPADTNDDGQVNVTDLLAVIGAWGCG